MHNFCGCRGYEYSDVSVTRISDAVYEKTEAERHRCEVEFVAKHDGEWIKEYLEKAKGKRGFESYKKLRDDVAKEYKIKNGR